MVAQLKNWVRSLFNTRGFHGKGYLFSLYSPVSLSLVPVPALSETRAKSNGFNHLFAVAEQFTPDFMVYVLRTRTYEPGAINPPALDPGSLPNYTPEYDPETITAWEAGSKLDFHLGEVIGRLNLGVYQFKYADKTASIRAIQSNGTTINYRANIGAAEYKGFEVSAEILPTESLMIRIGYSYLDAYYTKLLASDPLNIAQPGNAICDPASPPGTCLLDLSNNLVYGGRPKYPAHVTVSYQLPVAASLGRMTLSANVYTQARTYYDTFAKRLIEVLPDAKNVVTEGSYATLNLRGEWSDIFHSGFDAAIFVTNATNELYATSMRQSLLSEGWAVGNYAPPRMWGIEVSKRFGLN